MDNSVHEQPKDPAPQGRILVVEDVDVSARALVRILRDAGHEIARAQTAGEAWAALGRQPVDLVVLDLGLPDADGLDVLRALKQRPGPALPIVVVTGDAGSEVASLAAGADGFFTKPVVPAPLVARVSVLLRGFVACRSAMRRCADTEEECVRLAMGFRFFVHDLRNMLAVAIANLEFLRGDSLERSGPLGGFDGEARECVEAIDRAMREIERMSARALRDGGLPLRTSEVRLGSLATEVAAELRVAGRGVPVAVSGDAVVRADADLLRRVLFNLLHNAFVHAPSAPVTVSIEALRNGVFVGVRDRGPGVHEDLRGALGVGGLADPDRVREGHGLGLAFCQYAIAAHGGSFGVDGDAAGSIFWFILPRLPAMPA